MPDNRIDISFANNSKTSSPDKAENISINLDAWLRNSTTHFHTPFFTLRLFQSLKSQIKWLIFFVFGLSLLWIVTQAFIFRPQYTSSLTLSFNKRIPVQTVRLLQSDSLLTHFGNLPDFSTQEKMLVNSIQQSELIITVDHTLTQLKIWYAANEPEKSVEKTNQLGELIVSYIRYRNNNHLEMAVEDLQDNLRLAKQELGSAENELDKFLSVHQWLGKQDSKNISNSNLNISQQINSYHKDITWLTKHLEKLNATNNIDDAAPNALQLLSYSKTNNLFKTDALITTYNQTLNQVRQLQREKYYKQNLRYKQCVGQLNTIHEDLSNRLGFHLQQLHDRVTEANKTERLLTNRENKQKEILDTYNSLKQNVVQHSNTVIQLEKTLNDRLTLQTDQQLIATIDKKATPMSTFSVLAPYLQSIIRATFVASMMYLFGMAVMAFKNDTITSETEIEELVQLPVIARLPTSDFISSDSDNIANIHPVYQSIQTFLTKKNKNNIRLVLSSLTQNNYQSKIMENLGLTYAQSAKPVILVDCNFYHKYTVKNSETDLYPGLSEILSSPHKITVDLLSRHIHKTRTPNIYKLTCGNKTEALSLNTNTQRLNEIFEILKRHFPVIMVNAPALDKSFDVFHFREFSNCALVVVDQSNVTISKLHQSLKQYVVQEMPLNGVLLMVDPNPLTNT